VELNRLVHLEYLTVIWYILWPFGNLVAFVYFPRFWYNVSWKMWQPCSGPDTITLSNFWPNFLIIFKKKWSKYLTYPELA
jgi:hypothetical protein